VKEGLNGLPVQQPECQGRMWLWRKLQRVSGSIDRSPMFATPRSPKGEPCCGESLVINTLLINTVGVDASPCHCFQLRRVWLHSQRCV
jgi:hypothetical protein